MPVHVVDVGRTEEAPVQDHLDLLIDAVKEVGGAVETAGRPCDRNRSSFGFLPNGRRFSFPGGNDLLCPGINPPCSFLSLVLRKELDRRLEKAGHCFEWADINRDLKALREITIDDNGKTLVLRSECLGTCGKVFQSVGVAIPPVIREVA
ncbi:hypothetical protein HKBW3C_02538 [Candidatus Hakubella thermalkaliphila]|nr:hypothetical protein HKBW3C_02538 [Candidatus Hakubella thermalkaliphila]